MSFHGLEEPNKDTIDPPTSEDWISDLQIKKPIERINQFNFMAAHFAH
jgi:hypothetical protein